MKYGFIGLGNIGMPIARDLANSGHDLTVYDIVGDSAAELGSMGAQVADSAADVAQNANIIGICVRDAKDVRDVMEGSNGILSGARQGLLVAIHSTIGIDEVRGIAAKAQQKDVRVVDAPVSRGPGSPSRKGIVHGRWGSGGCCPSGALYCVGRLENSEDGRPWDRYGAQALQ